MKLIDLIKEAFENWHYQFPKDKEKQLYDFYVLSMLGEPEDMNLRSAYTDALNTLLPSLKTELLDAVYKAIVSELEHFDLHSFKKLNTQEKKFFQHFLPFFSRVNKKEIKTLQDLFSFTVKDNLTGNITNFARNPANRSVIVDFAKKAFPLFSKYVGRGYGGEAWQKICEGWETLNSAKEPGNMMVGIDHIYDLQHNNDTVFDKIRSYYKHGGLEWLSNALGKKANVKTLYELLPDVDINLQRFAQAVLKEKYGTTQEEFDTKILPIQKIQDKNDLIDHLNILLKVYMMMDRGIDITPEMERFYARYMRMLSNASFNLNDFKKIVLKYKNSKALISWIVDLDPDDKAFQLAIEEGLNKFVDIIVNLPTKSLDYFRRFPEKFNQYLNKNNFQDIAALTDDTGDELLLFRTRKHIKNLVKDPRIQAQSPERKDYLKDLLTNYITGF